MGSKEVEEHEPGPHESVLVNAGEESSKILVDQNEIGVDRRWLENGQKSLDIPWRKVVWARHWDQLEDEASKDVKHRAKRRVHKGDDGPATPKTFLSFCQDVSRR